MTEQGAILLGHYNYFLVVVSVCIAMLSAYAALDLAERVTSAKGNARLVWLSCGATAMGTGIWSMHYIGMEAMRLPAMCSYSPLLVAASVVLAIVISLVALWRVFALRSVENLSHKVVNAFILGAAIPVMHYVGMAAVHFTPAALPLSALNHAISISDLGIASVTLVTVLMLALVFVTSTIDRNFNRQALALEGSEQRYRRIVESTFDAFMTMDDSGLITDWSTQAQAMFGWTRDIIIGKNIASIFLSEQRAEGADHSLRDLLNMKTAGLQERIELTVPRRGGHLLASNRRE
jgi:two-component system, sensor histidine kinase and response regulator